MLCFLGGTAAMIAIHVYRRKHPEFAAYHPPVAQPDAKTDESDEKTPENAQQDDANAEPETPAGNDANAGQTTEQPTEKENLTNDH